MAVPKSVTKISRDGTVTYTSSVDAVQYTLKELTRGALRDVGKFVRKTYRDDFYRKHSKHGGQVGKGASYWVRSKDCDLQVGIARKGLGFWGGFFEVGTSDGIPKENILRNAVADNIAKIIEIESQYLSELGKDDPDLSGLSEGEYTDEE